MSGKSKQARVKNNAKPSSSSRSAELLGNAVTTFAGFSVHTEHGNWADSLESSLDPQLKLIMRKMCKKDPITKVKALNEFCELLNTSAVLDAKIILPFWTKMYLNLANDFDNRVRECSQDVLRVVALKFKKSMAPYVKQLVPLWIAGQFDNYGPAAIVASSSFAATFNNKKRDVCVFCRNEIVEYVEKNITFHTASTLSSSKNCTLDEAEQKYQRVLQASLKTVSFFLQVVNDIEYEKTQRSIQQILKSSKFWSFSKSKDPTVKAPWFEVMYTMLSNKSLQNLIIEFKAQIITVSFQNINISEPIVIPHVWGCIILEQTMFKDWYDVISFKKIVLPKLSSLLRHGYNRSFGIISPNLLPFLSKISKESLGGTSIHDFYKNFFDDIKEGLITFDNNLNVEMSAYLAAYYECLRYVMQQINNNINNIQEKSVDGDVLDLIIVAKHLLHENIFNLLTWCISKGGLIAKLVMMHTSMLLAYWSDPAKSSKLYKELLSEFWNDIISFTISGLSNERDNEPILNRIIEFIYNLYYANFKTENRNVKFVLKEEEINGEVLPKKDLKCDVNKNIIEVNQNKSAVTAIEPSIKKSSIIIYFESDLRDFVVQIVRFCLVKCSGKLVPIYISKIRTLTRLFNDEDFYARISDEETVKGTLNEFLRLLDNIEEDVSCDDTIDITFEILNFLPKDERNYFIREYLLKIPHLAIQHLVMNRLLSHPLIYEPEVRTMFSYPTARKILINMAKYVIKCNSKPSLHLLRKCFFENEKGKIPINKKTAEKILEILSEPLSTASKMAHEAEMCGSFIAHIMPVICSGGNTSLQFQQDIFLKLFKVSIERIPDKCISADTLWEITTCWQDALSNRDIKADMGLFHECKAIVEKYSRENNCLPNVVVESIATSITKYLILSTEHANDKDEHFSNANLMLEELFKTSDNDIFNANVKHFEEHCLFLETLAGKVSTDMDLSSQCMENIEMLMILRKILLNSCIIYELVCNVSKNPRSEHDDEYRKMIVDDRTVKQWCPVLYDETLRCVRIVAVTDSLFGMLQREFGDSEEPAVVVLKQLTEKVTSILRNGQEDFISKLKDRMLDELTKDDNISATRSLLFLVHIHYYNQFEDNSTIVVLEDMSQVLSSSNDLRPYVNTLQYFLARVPPKLMTTEMLLEKTRVNNIWIKAAILRCIARNNFLNCDFSTTSERTIMERMLELILELNARQLTNGASIVYNVDLHVQPIQNIVNAVEFINIAKDAITYFPYDINMRNWDTIRVCLCAWIVTASKSTEYLQSPKALLFVVNVFQLYTTFAKFINNERPKSSTEYLRNMIKEWDKLFDHSVTLSIFKVYHNLLKNSALYPQHSICYNMILEIVTPALEYINYGYVYDHHKTKATLEEVLDILFKNLSNNIHCIRITCMTILKNIRQYFVSNDIVIYDNKSENISTNTSPDWHFLCLFEEYIKQYEALIRKYLDEFNFKSSDVYALMPVDRNESLPYLLLWDYIIHVCAKSPLALRSVYTNWLHEKHYDEKFFRFVFRVMPAEILRNHDSKLMSNNAFKEITLKDIQDQNLDVEKYACHLYTELLRKLPVVVRKWWNTCQSKQKIYIDKLTTNFVSPIICTEELKALGNKKKKQAHMQVTVHNSTREVIATYSIDDARMELGITLPKNHPLGSAKVVPGRQLGGRTSARNTGMQLTVFLTHQNGSIFEGLMLWKKILDKKFQGLEDCCICYTIIHHETCQLPKLTCKTCRKKFHGPCLYKWFTTSSKSTCPICRNVF